MGQHGWGHRLKPSDEGRKFLHRPDLGLQAGNISNGDVDEGEGGGGGCGGHDSFLAFEGCGAGKTPALGLIIALSFFGSSENVLFFFGPTNQNHLLKFSVDGFAERRQKKAPLRGAGGLDPDVAGLEFGGFRRHDDAEGVVDLLLVAFQAGQPLDRAVGGSAPGHPHPRAFDLKIQCRLEGG